MLSDKMSDELVKESEHDRNKFSLFLEIVEMVVYPVSHNVDNAQLDWFNVFLL